MSTDTPRTRPALVLVALVVVLTASCAPEDTAGTVSTSSTSDPANSADIATTIALSLPQSDGSTDLTRLQERAIQAVLIMESTTFEEPLPWTDLPLFEWFAGGIDGIRFRDDIEVPFCCDPDGYIDLQMSNLAALETNRWIDPSSGTGLIDLVALFVHEARHNEDKPHTCDDDAGDETTLEMGAWAVEAFLYRWYADHADQRLFDDPERPGFCSQTAALDAERILETRFCRSGG